jgi:hypothetical protein
MEGETVPIAYLDCFCGISGDMLLGALIDCGVDLEHLSQEVRRVIPSGWRIEAQKVNKAGIAATQVTVRVSEPQPPRPAGEIVAMMARSSLPPSIKEKAARAFRLLAQAEAAVHGEDPETVHLHEVGATDAMVDVVGSIVGLDVLGVDHVVCSPLPLGSGSVQTEHGALPVPAPAVVELTKGLPVVPGPAAAELTTPTGAAIARVVCDGFGPMPSMRLEKVGYGAGKRDLPVPNVLRLLVGAVEVSPIEERLGLLETNIDDMNPEFFEHVCDRLFEGGALDVFLTPVTMKKGRPATMLSVLAEPAKRTALEQVLFAETTTLGVRYSEVSRSALQRQSIEVSTPWGSVRVKVGRSGEQVTLAPEYEDCRRVAQASAVPLKRVYEAAISEARRTIERK